MLRGDVERDEVVVESMEDVAGVAAEREEESRDVVTNVTVSERRRSFGIDDLETELGDSGHDHALPFACVRPDPFLDGGRGRFHVS